MTHPNAAGDLCPPTHSPFLDAAPSGCGRAIAEACARESGDSLIDEISRLRASGLATLACTLPVQSLDDVAVLVLIIAAELRDNSDLDAHSGPRINSALTAILDFAAPSAAVRSALGADYFGRPLDRARPVGEV